MLRIISVIEENYSLDGPEYEITIIYI